MSPSSFRSEREASHDGTQGFQGSGEPFGFLVARGPVVAATDRRAWLQAMLEVEVALAAAQGELGDIPAAAAAEIASVARADRFDVASLFAQADRGGVPVIGLIEALRASVTAETAAHVHCGATSQDIMDTAAMLVVGRCSRLVATEVEAGLELVGGLGREYGDTAMIGRTLGQNAVPTTFGGTTRRWGDGLGAAARSLRELAERLPVQLGGPVGDGATYGPHRAEITARTAERLGLVAPPNAWPTQRAPIADVAGAWGLAASALSGVATQIVALAASDVGELTERADGAGGSSSMPHKHNPIAAIAARAAAMQAPGFVATLLHCAGGHDFERASGAWHGEWPALHGVLRCVGSCADWLLTSLRRLTVDTDRMAANLRAAATKT